MPGGPGCSLAAAASRTEDPHPDGSEDNDCGGHEEGGGEPLRACPVVSTTPDAPRWLRLYVIHLSLESESSLWTAPPNGTASGVAIPVFSLMKPAR